MEQGRLRFIDHLSHEMGMLRLSEVVEITDSSVSVILKGSDPVGLHDHVQLDLYVDKYEPYKIALVSAKPILDPNLELPHRALSDAEISRIMNKFLEQKAAQDRFSGAVLLARSEQPFFVKAVGEASRQYHVDNRTDTKFNMGSMNKMLTGVAIAQLAQAGRLMFEDTVGEHLPEYPNPSVRETVTIHQLLTHTSGMSSYWEELFDTTYWKISTTEELASVFWEKPLKGESGEQFIYSNSGPVVLGLVIEAVSGLAYDEYISKHVTGPARMINTDCYRVDEPTENLAMGYTKLNYDGEPGDTWKSNIFMHSAKGGPAGGGYSTVEDLHRFHLALRSQVLLDRAFTDTVITGKVPRGPDWSYAYLFGDESRDGWRIVGHSGGAPGISAKLDMYWDQGWTVVVMANRDGVASAVADFAGKLMTHQRTP
ncbi:serine hydrolase [candidate division GN15 bacterium]|nr:serine hydrolase [candidate division GN15 bacterium]